MVNVHRSMARAFVRQDLKGKIVQKYVQKGHTVLTVH